MRRKMSSLPVTNIETYLKVTETLKRQSSQHYVSIVLFMPKWSTMHARTHAQRYFCDGAEVNTSSPKGKTRESRQTPKMTLNHFVDSEAILQLGTTRDSVFQKQVNATKYTLSRIHFRAALAFKQTRH